jgi:predicted transcriptional regulator
MNNITRNLFARISANATRQYYRLTAKDILKHTNNTNIKISENTSCESILNIMNTNDIYQITIVNKNKQIIGNLDYNTVVDAVTWQRFQDDEDDKNRYDLKYHGGS